MNYLHYLLILIVLYVYISYYYRYPKDVKVLHAYRNRFDTNLYLEKQPIVVLENTDSLQHFKKDTLPYLVISKESPSIQEQWLQNKYKYLLFQPKSSMELHVLPASKSLGKDKKPSPEETLITLQVKEDQIVILPFHWYYFAEKEYSVYGVHDYISWILP